MTPVGAHAYADQNRALIERNIRVASIVSVAGNLLLLVLVYRWLPAVALTVLPTFLAILWTTGLISSYPGEVNLISLAFIAILTGLGDDQVTYFFTRVPQEIATGRSLAEAIRRTYVTTGKSVLFCMLASATATLALAMASFKGLAELGLVLTVGLLMLLVHTLFTIPAVIFLIWPVFPVRTEGGPFRILPGLARGAGAVVARYPGQVLATGVGVLLAACAAMPSMQIADKLESFAKYDDPAFVGQRLLASRFGLEGAPLVLLVEGTEQDVLDRHGGPPGRARLPSPQRAAARGARPDQPRAVAGAAESSQSGAGWPRSGMPPPRHSRRRSWRLVWTARLSRLPSPGCASGAPALCPS